MSTNPTDRTVVIVNLTGHPLELTDGVDSVRLRSVGRARVNSAMKMTERVIVDGGEIVVPILSVRQEGVTGLPERRDGVLYVVSGITASVASTLGRDDVLAPGRVERDENGKGRRARALIRIERNDT